MKTSEELLSTAIDTRLLGALGCVNDYGLLRIFYKEETAKLIMRSLDEIANIVRNGRRG